jgi:putative transposase
MKTEITEWHHSPLHVFKPNMMYMITASTLHSAHLFRDREHLKFLQSLLFSVADKYCWKLQAWAVFSNHYHFIAQSPEDSKSLKRMIQHLHSVSAITINEHDRKEERKVWFQYWDTCLTYQKSYYARLNYVHYNPVKHGLVKVASHYPFCSAGWFEVNAKPSFVKQIRSFKTDKVNVYDEFQPVW